MTAQAMTANVRPFWKPQPIAPDESWIARTLKASLVVSMVGWAIYGLFALAFQDINIVPDWVQKVTVILGSALIVIGAEMNTPPTVVAVFRKLGRGKAHPLDIVALLASLFGSIVAALITFASRQTLLGEVGWRAWALTTGPLIIGVTIALDYYAAGSELGLTQADYETEMEDWLKDEQAWNERFGIELQPPKVQVNPKWPVARKDDLARVMARVNGRGPSMTEEDLLVEFARDQRRMPSPSTVTRYMKVLHGEKNL